MNQIEIINRWVRGEKGKASALSTRDGKLYSYNLLIGTTKKGRRILYDYAGKVSGTTTQHMNLVRELANEIIPKDFPE